MDLQLIDQSNHISLCKEIIQNSQEDSEHNGVLFGGPALPNRSAENTTRRLSQCGRCTSHINNSQPAVSASPLTMTLLPTWTIGIGEILVLMEEMGYSYLLGCIKGANPF